MPGDGLFMVRPYAENVENAFQTSPVLMEFLRDRIRGAYGAALDDTYLVAHSLGTQVSMDAMRLYQYSDPGQQLDTRGTPLAQIWNWFSWLISEEAYPVNQE